MTLSEDILTQLETSSELVALVSTRISPYVRNATTQTFPAVVFEITNTAIESDTSGAIGRCQSDLTVTALSRSYIEADEVADEVLAVLGAWSDDTACVAMTTPTAITRDQEMPYDGSQTLVYRCAVDFSVDHGVAI